MTTIFDQASGIHVLDNEQIIEIRTFVTKKFVRLYQMWRYVNTNRWRILKKLDQKIVECLKEYDDTPQIEYVTKRHNDAGDLIARQIRQARGSGADAQKEDKNKMLKKAESAKESALITDDDELSRLFKIKLDKIKTAAGTCKDVLTDFI